MSENLLEIRNLLIEAEVEGAWKPIVNGLSLSLKKGEIVGLIGESGAGKSTLSLAALGYTKPGCRIVSGSIRFDGPSRVPADQHSSKHVPSCINRGPRSQACY